MSKRVIRSFIATTLAASLLAVASVSSFAYTVQPGDTLSSLAAENNTTVAEIARINRIENVNMITSGQSLFMSEKEAQKDEISKITKGGLRIAADGSSVNLDLSFNSSFSLSLRNSDNPKYWNQTNSKLPPTTQFNASEYAELYPDVTKVYGLTPEKMLEHFLEYGWLEGRQPNADFDVNVYLSAYPDLQEAFKNGTPGEKILALYKHYNEFGIKENRTITNLEEAKKAGIAVYSAIDGSMLQEAPASFVPEHSEEAPSAPSTPVPPPSDAPPTW